MRANIVIDNKLMASAIKATGLKIKGAVVEQGLKLIIRQNRQQTARKLRGTLAWEGALSKMRKA